MKQVKLISLKANNFGRFSAIELDFEKFANEGVIAIKGGSGEGKSTIQNAIKTTAQGRKTLADGAMYGDDWATELQLVDGERKIFIEAVKKEGKSIDFKLYEKDENGKKVSNPIIDGVKATPAKYMEVIANELTFGIRDFLSDNNTVHNKMMFSLFQPELAQLGVETILSELNTLTTDRDRLYYQCQEKGAFMTALNELGYKESDLDLLQKVDISELTAKREELLMAKGGIEGNAKAEYERAVADYERKRNDISNRGVSIREKIEDINNTLIQEYNIQNDAYEGFFTTKSNDIEKVDEVVSKMSEIRCFDEGFLIQTKLDLVKHISEFYTPAPEVPIKPIVVPIIDKRIQLAEGIQYPDCYTEHIAAYRAVIAEFKTLKEPIISEISTDAIDQQIVEIDAKINNANNNNALFDRYAVNRAWVEASAKVTNKRQQLAQLYSKIDTGVKGLYMKPFFDEDKMELKTVYTGDYSPDYFRNDGTDERLLVSYSSTQRPIIGILLQVARLKRKAKALPYIFLDDVPMDNASRAVIAKIASDNGLTIITSITGDFDRMRLVDNEMLIEGGEVFFAE